MATNFANLVLGVDTSGLARGERALDKFGTQSDRTGRQVDKLGVSAKRSFNGIALAATAALGAIVSVGSAVRVIAEFETSMSRLGAVSRATSSELEALRDIAKDLGSTTEFSAAQAAGGLNFLAMAGFNATEAMAAIPSVLDLATASGMGLAAAADTASNIMSGFGIAAENAADVADVLAAASTRANTTVSQLGAAMSTVAPIASALDMSLENTAAAIGVLSDAGIQGERAGTGLRGVLAALAGPTTQAETVLRGLGLTIADVNPATNDLSVIMARLGEAGLSTADAMTLFGREAASGALVLIDGAKRVGEFGDELTRADGAAQTMAATMRDNLGGDLKGAMSAAQGLAIALGDAGLTAVIRAAVQSVTGLVRGITLLVSGFSQAIQFSHNFALNMFNASVATDNLTLAMGDEIDQANALFTLMDSGATMTQSAALAKLSQAEAHLRNAEAIRVEVQAMVDLKVASLELQRISANDALRSIAAPGTDLSQIAARQRDAYEELEQSLARIITDQASLNALANSGASEFEAAKSEVERIREAIANATDGMVVFDGELVSAVELSARLSGTVGGINFGNAISGAEALSQRLGVSLSLARLIAATAGSSGVSDEVFDPRSPLYNSAAQQEANRLAELAKIRKSFEDANISAAKLAATTARVGGAAKSAGRSAVEASQSAIEKLQERVRQEQELIGLSDTAKDQIEARHEVESALAADKVSWNEAEIDALSEQILLTKRLQDQARSTSQIVGSLADGIASGDISGVGGQILGMAQTGFSDLLKGSFGAGGGGFSGLVSGLKEGITGIGAAFKSGAGLIGGFTGAISAALPVIGAISAAISFFRTKTTELDSGVRILAEGFDLTLQTFSKVEKSKLGGLLKSVTLNLDEMEAATAGPLTRAIGDIQQGIFAQATALGAASDTFDNFSISIDAATKGLSESEAAAKLAEVLGNFSNNFAALIPGLAGAMREGEQFHETLQRITTDLFAVNEASYLFDNALMDMNITSAAAASNIVALSGGMEAFAAKTQFVFQNLFTDVQQDSRLTAIAMDQLNGTLDALGIAVPQTHAQFRALIAAQDRTTVSGQNAYAALLNVASAFVQVNGSAQEAAQSILAQVAAGQQVLSNRSSNLAPATDIETATAALALADMALAEAEGLLARSFAAAENAININYDDLIAAQETARDIAIDAADYATNVLSGAADDLSAAFGAARDNINLNYDRQIAEANEVWAGLQRAAAASAEFLTVAENALTASFNAEKERVTIAYQLQIDAATASADASRENVAALESISGSLSSALFNRLGLSSAGQSQQLGEGTEFLRGAVSAGGTTDQDGLANALSAVADPSKGLFESFAAYSQAMNVNTNLIDELGAITDSSLSIEEQSLNALESQILVLQETRDAELAALDASLSAILGLNTSVLSMTDATANYEAARGAEATATATVNINSLAAFNEEVARLEKQRNDEVAENRIRENQLLGIDTSVLSMEEATTALRLAQGLADTANAEVNASSLRAYADQIELLTQQRDNDLTALDAELSALQGIDTSVTTLGGAISSLASAQAAQAVATTALAAATTAAAAAAEAQASQFAAGSIGETLDGIYQSVLGRGVRAAGLDFYGNQFANGLSIADIIADITGSEEAQAFQSTGVARSFAGGGYTGAGARSGGMDGMGGFMAMLHPNETVIDHTAGAQTRRSSDNSDVVRELRDMREEAKKQRDETNSRIRTLQIDANKTQKTLNRWNNIGQPGFVAGTVVETSAT